MITLEQAVDAGCKIFVRSGTLDLAEVAIVVAVSRATLYRVVGSRDALLAAVLWRLAERSLDRARARRTRDGIDGVLQVVRIFARHALGSRPLRSFVAGQPETATRVLTSADGGVSQLAVAATVQLFAETGLTGGPRHNGTTQGPATQGPATQRIVDDPERVAYLLVRIVGSVCFAELAGTTPDLDLTETTVRAMLVQACTPRQSKVSRLMDAAMCLMWTSMPEAVMAESRLTSVLVGV